MHLQIIQDNKSAKDGNESPSYRDLMIKQIEERKKNIDKGLFSQL